jgi:Zn-dependent alcohol dehydrogenase
MQHHTDQRKLYTDCSAVVSLLELTLAQGRSHGSSQATQLGLENWANGVYLRCNCCPQAATKSRLYHMTALLSVHVADAVGAGGVGSLAIQLAKQAGARVITTCGAMNEKWVEKLGADMHFNYRGLSDEDIGLRVMNLTGQEGVDGWIDMVGPASGSAALQLLKFGGTLVSNL